ncbi:Reverse transcriptase RNA-dependent DNA polymerase [Trinorchestia longiramus]|nr:Reverse transcriptase RNA-dependent DNA polymerase [Trinorchestia longiramus]
MCQYRSRDPDEKSKKPLELVHSDLAGPISPTSFENSMYVMFFVDDFSGLIFVYFLKSKSDSVEAFKKFLADSAPFGSVKRLRTDNGTEYSSSLFKAVVMDNKIKHEFTAPYSPHQNVTAERSWRSLFEMARCLLLHANLPKELWNHAVRTAAYMRNRCFNKRTGKIPFEMFTGKKPDISNMHIFGSKCVAKRQNPGKLDSRSEQRFFVGYDPCSPAYLIYFSETRQIKRVRCVTFCDKISRNVMIEDEFICGKWEDCGKTDESEAELKPGTAPEGIQNETHLDEKPTRRVPLREKKPPIYLKDYVDPDECDITNHVVHYCYSVSSIPKSYSEAISSPDSVEWQKAMSDEMAALVDNETFELVAKPKERSVIGGRWVYSVKSGPNDQEIFKARYVAKGYSQVAAVDFTETFSPTARLTSVRMLMDIAVQNAYIVHQMDVCTAYLHAKIDCNVFVEQPEGFVELDKNGEKLVYKLKKSLYGIKQSGRNWNNLLHQFLVEQNFVQSLSDTCVYVRESDSGKVIIIVWVDDLIWLLLMLLC